MTLFKARDFWSIELGQIHNHESSTETDQSSEPIAHFIISAGRFSAIEDASFDVVVAGSLDGLMYLIQVPNTNLRQTSAQNSRQLLAAIKLDAPIVDLKCGFFSSALEQSVAVLSCDSLTVYQIKSRQIDLLDAQSLVTEEGPMLMGESLLSHEFELLFSFRLPANELAQSLLVLDSHSASSLTKSNAPFNQGAATVTSETGNEKRQSRGKFFQRSKQVVQLHLPQRDKLIVQYTRQTIVTLIDHKKIVGHFEFKLMSTSSTENRQQDVQAQHNIVQDKSQNVGCMPIAFMYKPKWPSIVVSLSDYKIYCVPLDKLNQNAKQDTVKRVALNLLQSSQTMQTQSQEQSAKTQQAASSLSKARSASTADDMSAFLSSIAIDLETDSEWTRELVSGAPIQMQGIRRLLGDAHITRRREEGAETTNECQLLVMSRYQLDSFSSLGDHLWSAKFETPLICFFSYTIELLKAGGGGGEKDSRAALVNERAQLASDEMITLLCTDCMSDLRSNLMILKEEQITWSALLNTKPLQLLRIDSVDADGLLVTFDIHRNLLTASYLGTNLNSLDGNGEGEDADGRADEDNQADVDDDGFLAALEQLDGQQQDSLLDLEPVGEFEVDQPVSQLKGETELASGEPTGFEVQVRLEAAREWPNVTVECRIGLLPRANSSKALNNIVALIEFNELIEAEVIGDKLERSVSYPSQRGNLLRVRLGNCWPDRREPIEISLKFSLKSSSNCSSGVEAMDMVDASSSQSSQSAAAAALGHDNSRGLLPKSLEVTLCLEYNEAGTGPVVQMETFLLPLSMLVRLAHVDYTCGSVNQSLADVFNNLGNLYKRRPLQPELTGTSAGYDTIRYHFCDLFINSSNTLIELLDELIESDLICRGHVETITNQHPAGDSNSDSTLEKLSLLAQSLSCRLRYRSPKGLKRESSAEDQSLPLMASFAFKFENSYANTVYNLKKRKSSSSASFSNVCTREDLVWIHVCEIEHERSSETSLADQLIKLHAEEFANDDKTELTNPIGSLISNNPLSKSKLLLSIESDNPFAVIFFEQHMAARLRNLSPLNSVDNSVQISKGEVTKNVRHIEVPRILPYVLVSPQLQSGLQSAKLNYDSVINDHKNTIEEFGLTYSKWLIAIATSLSLAKRLPDLSEDLVEHSKDIHILTKYYQNRMLRLLMELEDTERLDYELAQLPRLSLDTSLIEQQLEWPAFGDLGG